MYENDEEILEAAHKAILLNKFKIFCDRLEGDVNYTNKIRNILYSSNDKIKTVHNIFKNRFSIELSSDEDQYMLELVNAFLNKSSKRKHIPDEIRKELIKNQNGKCAFCNNSVDINDPVDHIVPFKYVGDELKNNYQILCENCNSSKNESLDYQVRVLLR